MTANWHQKRLQIGDAVGGGFFVFRRGRTTGRIKIDPQKMPFEHATVEDALYAARDQSRKHPGVTFSIFQQIAAVSTSSEES